VKYSIIIPTLNEDKLLPGILAQLNNKLLREKYSYEIIISDGGSTDKTLEIAGRLADRIICADKKDVQTIAFGRNNGAYNSNGDVLIFLNGDVLIQDPFMFFEYIENKFLNSNYLAMTCKVNIAPVEETLVDKLFHGFYNSYFSMLNSVGMGMGRGECQVIRKDIFNKVGGNRENLTAGEDFDLFKRIRRHGKILFAKELCIYESPRRYRKIGYWNVTALWFKNSVSVVLKKKSLSREWEQVR
jgi:glycosyltransferase involved in cell wall biosynthesis